MENQNDGYSHAVDTQLNDRFGAKRTSAKGPLQSFVQLGSGHWLAHCQLHVSLRLQRYSHERTGSAAGVEQCLKSKSAAIARFARQQSEEAPMSAIIGALCASTSRNRAERVPAWLSTE
ncbi:hypothetical protein ACSFA7_21925 [Variovorax sp. LT1R20]|uniref:hypothetical protein n=1 Tax=Variovorax sp. LT1R20 TaxID=3443729 RepID=UPI003F466A04